LLGHRGSPVLLANRSFGRDTVSLPGPADALAYNPKNGLVYVCHDDGEDVWVVDPGAQKIVTAIKIPTNPEFVVYDPITDKVFQNIKSQPVMIVIDLGPNSVAAIWSTIPAESPHGLAVNPESHRLFSAGKNGKLVVLDSVSGRSLGSVDIAEGVDQIAFDPGNKRIYCAAGQGKLTVLQETAEAVKSLGDVATPTGTHTLAAGLREDPSRLEDARALFLRGGTNYRDGKSRILLHRYEPIRRGISNEG
jgi:DNA-binding beta-propeller fold protein YncE